MFFINKKNTSDVTVCMKTKQLRGERTMGKQSKYSWAIFNVTFVILLFGVVFLFAGCGGGGGGSSHK